MEPFIFIFILFTTDYVLKGHFNFLLSKLRVKTNPPKLASAINKGTRAGSFIFLIIAGLTSHALGQTAGLTYKSGPNAGNPPTKLSPITEIIDFQGYNDTLASGPEGQPFEITMISGHILKFSLKKTGTYLEAVAAQTNVRASMGRVAYVPPSSTILPALYSTVKPCEATLMLENIEVLHPDGTTQSSSWNIIVIDAETTNNATESITTTTDGQAWTAWDLITNTMKNPIQSGIGTTTVNWTGTVNGETGAYAIASVRPTTISSRLSGVRQGISIGIQTYDTDFQIQACSGFPFNLRQVELSPSAGTSFTWDHPIISGIDGPETLSGTTSQQTRGVSTTQTLINHGQTRATATYTVTPYNESGIELAPFTVTVTVHPFPEASIKYPGSSCTAGIAEVTRTGQDQGVYRSTPGLFINPETGAIDLSASAVGDHTITYTFSNGFCTDSTTTEIRIDPQPVIVITDPPAKCAPGSVDLRTEAITAGSSPDLNFSYWKDVTASDSLLNPSSVSESGIYYIKGTTAMGCWDIKPVRVSIMSCPPQANNDEYSTLEDTPISINPSGILNNDTDVHNKPLVASLITSTNYGRLSLNEDGSFIYIPNPNFHGTDRFFYKVSNGQLESNVAIVIIIVTPVNDPPLAVDDAYSTTEDVPIIVNAPGILINDSDSESDALTGIVLNGPEHGDLVFSPNGAFTYTPNPDFHGVDHFTYKVTDGKLESNLATVTLTVAPANDPPLAADDTYTTTEDTPVTVNAPGILINDRDPDGDTLSAILVTSPENGRLTLNSNGSFNYIPNSHFYGIDRFTYEVSDGELKSDVAIVTIIVTPVNYPPVAVDDQFELTENSHLKETIYPNDFDTDGDSLIYSLIFNGGQGEIQVNSDGTFIYVPHPGFSGDDYFIYKVCDSEGACVEAKVFLTVKPLAVVSLTPSYSQVAEGNKVTINARLSQPLQEDVEIILGYDGDAQHRKDYNLFENFITIKIAAGQTISTEHLVIEALIDDINEKDEHISIDITDVDSDRVKIGTGAQVTILDLYPPAKEVAEETTNPDIKPDPLLSPNGDGQGNEHFLIDKIDLFPNNKVLIFNRWGNQVFRATGYDNYANSFRGFANTGILTNPDKNLPEGVYYYLIYTITTDNQQRLNKGYLILKR
jgi:hypothetical protein